MCERKIGLYPHGTAVLAHEAGFHRQRFALAGEQRFNAIARALGVIGVAEIEQTARAQRLRFMACQRAQRTVHVEESTLRRAQANPYRRMFDRSLVQVVVLKHGDAFSRMRQSRGWLM